MTLSALSAPSNLAFRQVRQASLLRPGAQEKPVSASTAPNAFNRLNSNTEATAPQVTSGSTLQMLPWARSLYNNFDYDRIPSGKFANMSLQDVTILGLVTAIYVPETIGAFKHGLHPYETLGRNGLSLAFRVLITILTKNDQFSINSWLLDSAMQDRKLAKPEELKHPIDTFGVFWHNQIKKPIQETYGMNGDFIHEVLKPAVGNPQTINEGIRYKTKWTKWKGNHLDTVTELMNRRYQFVDIKSWWEHHLYNLAPRLHANNKNLDMIPESIPLKDSIKEIYQRTEAHTKQLIKTLAPNNILFERSKHLLDSVFEKEGQLKASNDIDHAAFAFERAWRLFPFERLNESQSRPDLKMTFKDWVQQARQHRRPEEGIKAAKQALEAWLKKRQLEWGDHEVQGGLTKDLPKRVAKLVSSHFEKSAQAVIDLEGQVDKRSTAVLQQRAEEVSAKGWAELFNANHLNQGVELSGKLSELLEPVFHLSERVKLAEGFLGRHTFFMNAQVAFLSVLQALIVGQFMMLIVFHTFARLDDDFDASVLEKNKKHKAGEATEAKPSPFSALTQGVQPLPFNDPETMKKGQAFASTWQQLNTASELDNLANRSLPLARASQYQRPGLTPAGSSIGRPTVQTQEGLSR